MSKIIDFDNIQAKRYLIDETTMNSFFEDSFDFASYDGFTNFVNNSFETIFDKYKDTIPKDINNNINISIRLKNQVKTELLLQILNLLSTITSEHISANNAFFKKITSDNSFQFMSSRTFDDFIREIISVKRFLRTNTGNLVSSDFINNGNLYYEYSIAQKNSLLEESPLSEYIFSHTHFLSSANNIQIPISPNSDYYPLPELEQEMIKPTVKSIDKSEKEYFNNIRSDESIHGNTHYLYNKEGSYLLAVLFQIIHEDTGSHKYSPYIRRNSNKLSSNSLNHLTDTLYKAYKSKGVQSDKLESSLFLIGAETIYHPSWNKTIISSFKNFVENNTFDHGSPQEVFSFKNSFQTILQLQKCPLNSVKIFLWESYFSKCLSTKTKNVLEHKYSSYSSYMAQKTVETIQDMTNCFYYLLLERYDYLPEINTYINDIKDYNNLLNINFFPLWKINRHFSEEELKKMKKTDALKLAEEYIRNCKLKILTLKHHILSFLAQVTASYTSWSILHEQNKNRIAIDSTGDNLLDGALPYILYLNDNNTF